ncbi:MAG: hypothetical protein JKX92_16110 [Porticoccaceae bacterium]|nr:hypothetical protein [Porticoccaceae bacterium]
MLMIVVGLVVFFGFGRFSVTSVEEYREHNVLLQESVERLTQSNKELFKQQDFVENSRKIDLQAQHDSRRSLAKLHKELSDIKQQLAFYQRVVAPETIQKGLYIDSFKVFKQSSEDSYQFQIIVVQSESQKRAIKGHYAISINGLLKGKDETISMQEKGKMRFSFRYYQLLENEIKLPSDFVPRRIEVIITPTIKSKKMIKKQWQWVDVIAEH